MATVIDLTTEITPFVEAFLMSGADDNLETMLLARCKLALVAASYNTNTRLARCEFSLTVNSSMTNGWGSLHGGSIATLMDICTSLCAAPTVIGRQQQANKSVEELPQDNWMFGGVSRTLNVSYLRPAMVDEELLLECEALAMGKQLASVRGSLKRRSDRTLIAICEHGMVKSDPSSNISTRL
jgi:acyl-coenzyme A thioesterase 13